MIRVFICVYRVKAQKVAMGLAQVSSLHSQHLDVWCCRPLVEPSRNSTPCCVSITLLAHLQMSKCEVMIRLPMQHMTRDHSNSSRHHMLYASSFFP